MTDLFDEASLSEYEISDYEYSDEETEYIEKRDETRKKRARKDLMTPRLATVLDRSKLSERDTVHLLNAVLESVNIDPADYVINRESVRKLRNMSREKVAKSIKENFLNMDLEAVTIHWDGKMLSNIDSSGSDSAVERLAVVVSASGIEKLLAVPKLSSSTGAQMSSAVYNVLEEWNLLEIVQAFSFDTTASNTGRLQGACLLLERELKRDILYLGCRHHIAEIILSAVFKTYFSSSGPDIALFKRFKDEWLNMKIDAYENGLDDFKNLFGTTDQNFVEITEFCSKRVAEKWFREDYKEFLELVLLFLGSDEKFSIRRPGAFHHARWMSKAIYSLKMYLFRSQFKLTEFEKSAILQINAFIIKCYITHWFVAHRAEKAPLADLKLLRALHNYPNKKVSEIACKKIVHHLYYFSEECVMFSLWDDDVSSKTKSLIAKKITSHNFDDDEGSDGSEEDGSKTETRKKYDLKIKDIAAFLRADNERILLDLVTHKSQHFFKRFCIPMDFLEREQSEWEHCADFLKGKDVVRNLKVTNDAAERGIKLLSDYNQSITKDHKQQTYLLQVIS